MVTQYGMTERIGAIKLGVTDDQPFLGRNYGHTRDYSEQVAGVVDGEIQRLISNAHQEAYDILVANREVLDHLVEVLLEKETILKDEIAKIFAKVKKVQKRPAWTGSSTRVPSSKPPVAAKAAKVVEVEPEEPKKARKKAAPKEES
jgi:cell division protease FtsH